MKIDEMSSQNATLQSQVFQGEDVLKRLEAAESWSEKELEERYKEIVEIIHPVLLDAESDHELRLDCVRWLGEKICKHVPVFEAEDTVYYPLLSGILDFLQQVFEAINRSENSDKVLLLSVACALVDHTDQVLVHAIRYEGLGPGEVPSIPRCVPKILVVTFRHCGGDYEAELNSEVKSSLLLLFSKVKSLLDTFTGVIEKLKIRTVLEDEFNILVELCNSLTEFHEVLYNIDLRSCLKVWQLYGKLLQEHSEKLKSKLELAKPIFILLHESVDAFDKLLSFDQHTIEQEPKRVNRCVVTVTVIAKLFQSLSSILQHELTSEFHTLVRYIEHVTANQSQVCNLVPTSLAEKLRRDVYQEAYEVFLLTKLAAPDRFRSHVKTVDINRQTGPLYLDIVVKLFEHSDSDALEDTAELLDCVMNCFNFCQLDSYSVPSHKGIEVPGNPVTCVEQYEWVLTHTCSFISTLTPDAFKIAEEVIWRTLLSGQHSACQLASDIICFLCRYGSSQLCYDQLATVSQIYLCFEEFAVQKFWLELLIPRLYNFLSDYHRKQWNETFSPAEPENLPLWSLLPLPSCGSTDNDTLQLLSDVLQNSLTAILADLDEADFSLSSLTTLIRIAYQLVEAGLEVATVEDSIMPVTVWRKLAEHDVVVNDNMSEMNFINSLALLTSVCLPKCRDNDLRIIFVSIKLMLEQPSTLQIKAILLSVIKILQDTVNLDFMRSLQDFEPSLVEDIGAVCHVAQNATLSEPTLHDMGLITLRNIAETTESAEFVRLCADEDLVIPHFTEFLQLRPDQEAAYNLAKSLLDTTKTGSESKDLTQTIKQLYLAPEHPETKRKLSPKRTCFSPELKKVRKEGLNGDPDQTLPVSPAKDVNLWLANLEKYSRLIKENFEATDRHNVTPSQRERLRVIRDMIDASLL